MVIFLDDLNFQCHLPIDFLLKGCFFFLQILYFRIELFLSSGFEVQISLSLSLNVFKVLEFFLNIDKLLFLLSQIRIEFDGHFLNFFILFRNFFLEVGYFFLVLLIQFFIGLLFHFLSQQIKFFLLPESSYTLNY